jgi:hypothetical protein
MAGTIIQAIFSLQLMDLILYTLTITDKYSIIRFILNVTEHGKYIASLHQKLLMCLYILTGFAPIFSGQ